VVFFVLLVMVARSRVVQSSSSCCPSRSADKDPLVLPSVVLCSAKARARFIAWHSPFSCQTTKLWEKNPDSIQKKGVYCSTGLNFSQITVESEMLSDTSTIQ